MTRTVNCLERRAATSRRRPHETDGRQVRGRRSPRAAGPALLADRRRRDAWLASRLRELTPDERAVLRRAARSSILAEGLATAP